MNDLQLRIGQILANRAIERRRTTYPELAAELQWGHPLGRGLGHHLYEVMHFCHSRGYPILTTIVVEAGTTAPKEAAIPHIRVVIGDESIADAQKRVFNFAWVSVPDFGFLVSPEPEIDYSKLFGSRVWGFDPTNWGMACFAHQTTRDNRLTAMGGEPIYLVSFCTPNPTEDFDGQQMIDPNDVGKMLGISEVQPIRASAETYISESVRADIIARTGQFRWQHGLVISRAWRFKERPLTLQALPTTRSAGWIATNDMVPLTADEILNVQGYEIEELNVFGRSIQSMVVAYHDPKHTTYLFVCGDKEALKRARAPLGTKLVKIGVTGDFRRRLGDLNDHHFARIFGVQFEHLTHRRWPTQEVALLREANALQWAMLHTRQASGEYFFMTDEEIISAASQVVSLKPGQ